ncbi:MAG: cytochrome c-type biogenesis CcmF C-terminal domain-containing protein [Actinomycetota bacterium]|nr:cytochrome c-type biogenesis CcmF C-terminal domain-containing protein [Actinomycetota bacterium]
MAQLGRISILISLLSSATAAAALLYGLKMRHAKSVRGGHLALLVTLFFTALASLALLIAFLTRDFSLTYVYNHSNRSLSPLFTISAFWGGQEGSLLFWQLLTSICSAVFLASDRKGRLSQHALFILALVQLFFLVLLAEPASPFKLMGQLPSDGLGLNPLLLHLQMVFHPPILFMGYAAFTIPFALGLAALTTGQTDGAWVERAKKWTLFAHLCLGIGILLGALWAYDELAFGGYWAFDPVENASLLPWLAGSALLHSLNIHQRRAILKIWSVALAAIAFFSCLLATFITRSGVIESVHAFGHSPIAAYFTWFLVVLTAAFIILIIFKGRVFASDEMESLLSKDYGFHLNNILLVFFSIVITFGTFYPVITEAAFGSRISLGPLFFNRIIPPLGYIYLLFLGICPLLGQKATEREMLIKKMTYPLLAAATLFSLAFFLWGNRLMGSLGFGISAFTFVATLSAIFSARVEGTSSLAQRFVSNRSKYGGYLAHLGIAIIFVGLIGTNFYAASGQATLKKGESFMVGDLQVTNLAVSVKEDESRVENIAALSVETGGERMIRVEPKLIFHKDFGKSTAKVDIKGGLLRDIYANLMKFHEDGTVHVEIKINPFASWLWMGAWVLFSGTLAAFWPKGRGR